MFAPVRAFSSPVRRAVLGTSLSAREIQGRHFTALGRAGNRDWIIGLGADPFIDYRSGALEKTVPRWSVMLDCVSMLQWNRIPLLLDEHGQYVDIEPQPRPDTEAELQR
jgi:NADPH:quinone reductase-like Zn-dependent oxidoreductase